MTVIYLNALDCVVVIPFIVLAMLAIWALTFVPSTATYVPSAGIAAFATFEAEPVFATAASLTSVTSANLPSVCVTPVKTEYCSPSLAVAATVLSRASIAPVIALSRSSASFLI